MCLGEIELVRNNSKAALDQFAIALNTWKHEPKLYNVIAVALTLQGNYKLARQNFDEGLRLKPDYPALINNYGLMELRAGDFTQALATFSALLASHATDRYSTNRALVELALGQTDAALNDAPGMDVSTLRQTLGRYRPGQTSASIAADVHLETSAIDTTSVIKNSTTQSRGAMPPPMELSKAP